MLLFKDGKRIVTRIGQPLTAPPVIPLIKYFWNARNTIIVGIIMMQLAALRGPQLVPELCINAVIPMGSVLTLEVDRSTEAHSNSPHQPRKQKIAFVAVAGNIIGRTTLKNTLISLQPSIRAASIIVDGIVLKKLR